MDELSRHAMELLAFNGYIKYSNICACMDFAFVRFTTTSTTTVIPIGVKAKRSERDDKQLTGNHQRLSIAAKGKHINK